MEGENFTVDCDLIFTSFSYKDDTGKLAHFPFGVIPLSLLIPSTELS